VVAVAVAATVVVESLGSIMVLLAGGCIYEIQILIKI
jgi:hypothetical protein